MKSRGWSRWGSPVWLAVWLLGGTGCVSLPPEVATLPLGVQVENPGHLRVGVMRATKRPLTAAELRPFEHGGFRWDYSVEFTDTAGVGVQFMVVEASVRSLTGVSAATVTRLASRVEPMGTTPIQIHAILSSSNPDEPGNVSGVQELTFLGVDDRGESVRVIVRVPLV